MADGRYHHGDLRAALLTQAEKTLRDTGADGLSLRELARAIGVSHGAPRRHFEDRSALLEELAAEGWRRLGMSLAEAAAAAGDAAFDSTLKQVGIAFVRFAVDNAALTDLMSTSKHLANASQHLESAREQAIAPVAYLVESGLSAGDLAAGVPHRIGIVLFATLHGIATLANNKMIDPLEDELIIYAVESLLHGLALPDKRIRLPLSASRLQFDYRRS
jgi:AcrR family transcriptional regulator